MNNLLNMSSVRNLIERIRTPVLCLTLALCVITIWNFDSSQKEMPLLEGILIIVTGVMLSVLVFVGIFWQEIIQRRAMEEKADYHGSAGFAPEDEFNDLQVNSDAPLSAGSFALAPWSETRRLDLPRQIVTRHVLVLGPSGSGKTRTFFIPNCAWTRDASFVATDPKGELWDWTSGYQKDPRRYAPREPDKSECLNWIPLCRDAHLAMLLARAVMESEGSAKTDPFWIDAESAFLASLFAHTATLKEPTPACAYDLLTSHSATKLINALLNSSSTVARQFANVFMQADAKLRGSIVIAVATRLLFLSDPAVRRFTSASTQAPDWGQLRQGPVAVYWVLQENDIALLKPLSTLFFTLMLYQLKKEEPRVPVTLYLDELANIGRIPDFAGEVTVARGRDIALVLGLQSLAQLTVLYSQAPARTIIDNCQTKIALAGLANDSAELVSRELGDATIMIPRLSWTNGRNPSSTFSRVDNKRRLLTADEVRRLETEDLLVISTNRRPLLLTRFHYAGAARSAETRTLGSERSQKFEVTREVVPELPPPLPLLPEDLAS